jgi:hypothetical protein
MLVNTEIKKEIFGCIKFFARFYCVLLFPYRHSYYGLINYADINVQSKLNLKWKF